MNFEKWLLHIGESQKTAKNYAQAIDGSLSNWAIGAELISSSLTSLNIDAQLDEIFDSIRILEVFAENDRRGKGMYSAALRHFQKYRADIGGYGLTEDIESILSNNSIPVTEQSAQISIRLGQGEFRDALIEYWGGCAVSNYRDCRFLVASHIKPWSKSSSRERLDSFNGLLLLPNLDKLFDLGYITFEESGAIRVSSEIEKPEMLGIHESMKVELLKPRHQEFMAYHRDEKFWKL